MSQLFTPLTVRGLTLRNRLWVAPMCQYSAQDGLPNDWHHVHLAQFASGGAGLVVAEATAVVPGGRITPEDTGLWNDAQRDAWTPIVAAIHARGAAAGIQLAHAGRKASTYSPFSGSRGSVPADEGGWTTRAPSAVAFDGYAAPQELTDGEIDELVAAFASAANRAVLAGFDVLEIHAAHGYLLHEFLSPLSNRRDDAWGGSLRNRMRLPLEVIRRIRAAVPDLPLGARISVTDWVEGGLAVEDGVAIAKAYREAGVAYVCCSSGGNSPANAARTTSVKFPSGVPRAYRNCPAVMRTLPSGSISHSDGTDWIPYSFSTFASQPPGTMVAAANGNCPAACLAAATSVSTVYSTASTRPPIPSVPRHAAMDSAAPPNPGFVMAANTSSTCLPR